MLHRLRLQAGADVGERGFARVPVERRGAHLDELVGGERAIDFREYRVGQSAFANVNGGVEGMRARLERLADTRFYLLPFLPPSSFL